MDEEVLDEEYMPPSSHTTQQPTQPNKDDTPTMSAQDNFEANRPLAGTPPITRSKSLSSPYKILVHTPEPRKIMPKSKVFKIPVCTPDTVNPKTLANTPNNNTPLRRSSQLPKPNPKFSVL